MIMKNSLKEGLIQLESKTRFFLLNSLLIQNGHLDVGTWMSPIQHYDTLTYLKGSKLYSKLEDLYRIALNLAFSPLKLALKIIQVIMRVWYH